VSVIEGSQYPPDTDKLMPQSTPLVGLPVLLKHGLAIGELG
jgi:hypothetical protein